MKIGWKLAHGFQNGVGKRAPRSGEARQQLVEQRAQAPDFVPVGR